MKPKLCIHELGNNKINIVGVRGDFYLDYDVLSLEAFKYEDSVTINLIYFNELNKEDGTKIGCFYNVHDYEQDETIVQLKQDGYYSIRHLVIPKKELVEQLVQEYPEYVEKYTYILCIDSYGNLYRFINNEFTPIEESFLEINLINCNCGLVDCECFFIGDLYKCYINASKELLNSGLSKCSLKDLNTFNRDFLWMSINVIQYLACQLNFCEALRILELITSNCLNLCGDNLRKENSCGCHA